MNTRVPNINAYWAGLVVEELVRNGVDQFFVASGSRSSPLALAVASNRRAVSAVHFDERGLAFYALGRARRTGRASAIITTSGTAAANLFPAIVEASQDDVPMVVLTADRPPEIRDAGANQSIDQVKMYGAYVRWFFDLPCPDEKIPPAMVLTTIDQAVHRARGPVHLNCMFREPLAPIADGIRVGMLERSLREWRSSGRPYTTYASTTGRPDLDMMADARRGLVVVGALRNQEEVDSVSRFISRLRWPVLPDILSGLRLSKGAAQIAPYADLILERPLRYRPDTVLHLGGRILSKRVNEYLASARPPKYVMVNDSPGRIDPSHGVTHRIQATLTKLPAVRGNSPGAAWRLASARVEKMLAGFEAGADVLSEPLVARLISRNLPAGHALFLGNSMPIRDMNMFAAVSDRAIRVGANRGASGIDGSIASGLGFGDPVTIVVGDLAALHDLNSLALAREHHPAVIVVLNNDGGGIFSFLPVVAAGAHFEKYFGTPHGLMFKSAAAQFGLNYSAPRSRQEFLSAYRAACRTRLSTLIEVRTDRAENVAVHHELRARVAKALAG